MVLERPPQNYENTEEAMHSAGMRKAEWGRLCEKDGVFTGPYRFSKGRELSGEWKCQEMKGTQAGKRMTYQEWRVQEGD